MFLALENAGLTGVLTAPTYGMLADITRAMFLDILDRAGLVYSFEKARNLIVLACNGTTVMFRSMEKPERLRGPNLAFFGCDELTYSPYASFLRLKARLRDIRASRLQGVAAWTPKGFDEYYKLFIAKKNPDYRVIMASAKENAANLAPGFYEDLKRAYDELFYKQEVLGEYLDIFATACYWAFSSKETLAPVTYNPELPLCWSLDFNVNPMASVIIQWQKSRPGQGWNDPPLGPRVNVIDEITLRSSNTHEALQEFVNRYQHHRGPLWIYGDPAGGQRNTATSKTDWQVVREFFDTGPGGRAFNPSQIEFRVQSKSPLQKERILATNALLRNSEGYRAMRINEEKCPELVSDLRQVGFKPGSSVIDKDKDGWRTHWSDALGYWVWYEYPLRKKIGEQGRPM